jgi:RAB protein geranylgeranyltransferase component A
MVGDLMHRFTPSSLSKAGFKVAHVDENAYYGADEASLSLDEFIKWADERSNSPLETESKTFRYMVAQRSRFTSVTHTAPNSLDPRGYSLSLSPSVIPAVGPLTASLISSGVSRYGSFRLLGRVGIYDRSGKVKAVPESKEHIFKSKEIGLLDKRRLMRFLMFAASDFEGKGELTGKEEVPFYEFIQSTFSLDDEAARAIVFALSHCISKSGIFTLQHLQASHLIPPRRYNFASPDAPSRLSSFCRSLWGFSISNRILWRRRRYSPRLLPCIGGQWRGVHPWQAYFFYSAIRRIDIIA